MTVPVWYLIISAVIGFLVRHYFPSKSPSIPAGPVSSAGNLGTLIQDLEKVLGGLSQLANLVNQASGKLQTLSPQVEKKV